jgi:protein required for attachment to host cells
MKENSWILVANHEKARLYKIVKIGELEEFLDFEHPQRKLKETDVYSAPPGRTFQSPGGGNGSKQGDTRHSYQPHTTFKDKKDQFFAKEIVKHLTHCFECNEFKNLYIFAEPHFLGVLKKSLPANVMKATVQCVAKDLVNLTPDAVWEHSEIA